MPKKTTQPEGYENNPFFIAGNGISLLFKMARGVAIFLAIISVLMFFFTNWPSGTSDQEYVNSVQDDVAVWSTNDWLLAVGTIAILALAFVMIASLFSGISAYTAVQLSKGRSVTFNEAFNYVFERLWSYIWLKVIIGFKLLLWFLLLIIPGVIMSVRYSLADLAFFDEDKKLRGNAAVKESVRMTRGAWLTTFSATTLFNVLTFGSITYIVTTAANAILYRQLDKLGEKKPDAHWLAWLTLIFPIVLFLVVMAAIVSLAVTYDLIESS